MRINDHLEEDRSLKQISLFLEVEEVRKMRDALNDFLEHVKNKGPNWKSTHCHINDRNFKHEVLLVIYNPDNLGGLNDRSKRLIQDDI